MPPSPAPRQPSLRTIQHRSKLQKRQHNWTEQSRSNVAGEVASHGILDSRFTLFFVLKDSEVAFCRVLKLRDTHFDSAETIWHRNFIIQGLTPHQKQPGMTTTQPIPAGKWITSFVHPVAPVAPTNPYLQRTNAVSFVRQ